MREKEALRGWAWRRAWWQCGVGAGAVRPQERVHDGVHGLLVAGRHPRSPVLSCSPQLPREVAVVVAAGRGAHVQGV